MAVGQKEINICVTSEQRLSGDEPSKYELYTVAKYSEKNGTKYISYDESEMFGFASSVMLIITDGTVKVRRYGENQTVLFLKEKHRCNTTYKTPYVAFDIEIMTEKVIANVCEDYGNIELIYTVAIDGSEANHSLKIRY